MSATLLRPHCFALLVFSLQFCVYARGASQTSDRLANYETARQEAIGRAQNEIQLMDLATPEELQSLWDLFPGMNSEMNRESSDGYMHSRFEVEIDVDIARQSLTVAFPGGVYSTVISSARAGYHTVRGCFTHPHLELMHYSSKYENSPMPHSMFFYGGYAIHGTEEESELGRPVSHGCIRVSRADAGDLYGIVEEYGPSNTRICVH